MQFSPRRSALAALLMASVQAACHPRHFHQVGNSATPALSAFEAFSVDWTSLLSAPTTTSSAAAQAPATTLTTVTSAEAAAATPKTSSSSSSSSAAAATTSAASGGSSSSSGLTSDEQSALDQHNAARSDVGEAALTWSASLASDAQSWADNLASTAGSSGSLTHSDVSDQGENLYWQSGGGAPFAAAAEAWIAEKSSYNGEAITGSGGFENYGHYTQIIWSSTTEVGMAAASDGAGGYYVVARYTPAGNVIGETPTNAS